MTDGQRVPIAKAKGRPMLQWVGKRPLREVRSFAAQLVERYAAPAPEGAVSGDVLPRILTITQPWASSKRIASRTFGIHGTLTPAAYPEITGVASPLLEDERFLAEDVSDPGSGDVGEYPQAGWTEGRRRVKRYSVVFERAGRTLSAYVPDLPGCVATGRTRREVERRIREAIDVHVAGRRAAREPVPEPNTWTDAIDI